MLDSQYIYTRLVFGFLTRNHQLEKK